MSTRRGGCLFWALAILGLCFLLVVAAGAWAWFNRETLMRSGTALVVEGVSGHAMNELAMNESDRATLHDAVGLLTERIRDGRLGPNDLRPLMENRELRNPLLAVLARGLLGKHLPKSGYDDATLAAAQADGLRFQVALLAGKVSNEVLDQLGARTVEKIEADGRFTLKESILRDDLDACIRMMREAADQAGIAPGAPALDPDPAAILRQRLQQHLEPTPLEPVEPVPPAPLPEQPRSI